MIQIVSIKVEQCNAIIDHTSQPTFNRTHTRRIGVSGRGGQMTDCSPSHTNIGWYRVAQKGLGSPTYSEFEFDREPVEEKNNHSIRKSRTVKTC